MSRVSIAVISGLAVGGTYALITLGMVLVFRATHTFNFAHGALMLVAAYFVGQWQAEQDLPFAVQVLSSIAITMAICVAFYLVVLRRTIGLPIFMSVVATLGLASILDGAMGLWFEGGTYSIRIPFLPDGVWSIFGARIRSSTIALTVFSYALALSIAAVLRYTHLGTRVRAAGQDPLLASQSGINVHRIHLGTWATLGALAAIGGIVYGNENLVTLELGAIGFVAIPALVLGGIDSVEGAVLGGVLVGVMQGFIATYVGGDVVTPVTYGLLLVVLLVRPTGLLGTQRIERV